MLIRSGLSNSAESVSANNNSFLSPQQYLPEKSLLVQKDVFFGRSSLESVMTAAFRLDNPPRPRYLPPTPAGGGDKNPSFLQKLIKGHYLENATVPVTIPREKGSASNRKPLAERKQ